MAEFSEKTSSQNNNSEWDEIAKKSKLGDITSEEQTSDAVYTQQLKTRDGFSETITAKSQEELDEKVKEFYEGEADRWSNR